jgi:hypothetical protein
MGRFGCAPARQRLRLASPAAYKSSYHRCCSAALHAVLPIGVKSSRQMMSALTAAFFDSGPAEASNRPIRAVFRWAGKGLIMCVYHTLCWPPGSVANAADCIERQRLTPGDECSDVLRMVRFVHGEQTGTSATVACNLPRGLWGGLDGGLAARLIRPPVRPPSAPHFIIRD